MKFPPGQLARGLLLSNIFPWIISPWTTTPRQLPTNPPPPLKMPPETSDNGLFPCKIYPWIIYKWRSKKVLFTHSNSEIFLKSWKKKSKGLCMLFRGDILLRGNPFYRSMELGFNSGNTRTRCHLFKINNKDSRAMISFCLGVDWVSWHRHRFKTNLDLLKVNNIHTRLRCGICSKLTMNSTERYQWRRNDLFIDNFEHVSLFILVFLLLNLGMFLFARLDEYNAA